MAKTHFRKVFKSDHLGCADLEDYTEQGSDLIFTIKNVRQEYGAKVAGKKIDANIAYFKENIKPFIDKGENILIAAHGNSLRAMMIELGMYKPEEISNIELPTGSPLCINLDHGRLVDFKYLD